MQTVAKTKTIIFVICIFIFSHSAYSQVLISSAGNTVDKGNLSVSWSLGEIAIHTLQSGNMILTQGFHQSNLTVTSVFNRVTGLELNVFPNPATEIINIKVDNHHGLSYSIFNTLGTALEIKTITGTHTKIPVQKLNSGMYYLNVYKNERLISTYKISVIK